MKKLIRVIRNLFKLYNDKQIPLASAALCYYLIMTVFPMIICLYTLMGQNYDQVLAIFSLADGILNPETMETLKSFLLYVSENHSMAMAIAGGTVLVTSASAGMRSMQITIGRMQGGQHFKGIAGFIMSMLFSLVFLAAIWFSVLVMFTSRDLLDLVTKWVPFIDLSGSWHRLRYVMLGGIMFLMLWAIYRIARKKSAKYQTWPGAILATIGIVGMSWVFSGFISASARYSLVYGSLASVILLMYWMFLICQVIYIGAAFNVSIRDEKRLEREMKRLEAENMRKQPEREKR
mgnify:CR=1 FL=1